MITEVEQEPVTKERKVISQEQKDAATMRRDATLLRKYGNDAKADELDAKADELFPQSTSNYKRVDPLQVLTTEEQKALRDYFRTANGFAKLCSVVSAKKLQAIVLELSA